MTAIRSAYNPGTEPNQAVYTSETMLGLVLAIFGRITCDPFPGDGAPATLLAETRCTDGFSEPWPSGSYANPPFKRLGDAMRHAKAQRDAADVHYLLLGPAQTHRVWFWECGGDVKMWLKQLPFHGHKDTFPKPLVLHYYGTQAEHVRAIAKQSEIVVYVS